MRILRLPLCADLRVSVVALEAVPWQSSRVKQPVVRVQGTPHQQSTNVVQRDSRGGRYDFRLEFFISSVRSGQWAAYVYANLTSSDSGVRVSLLAPGLLSTYFSIISSYRMWLFVVRSLTVVHSHTGVEDLHHSPPQTFTFS